MSYLIQSSLANDQTIMLRVTACAASQGIADPSFWAQSHMWQLSAEPGWVDVYKYAVDSGDTEPGANEGAVTDGMILAAVQALQEVPDEL